MSDTITVTVIDAFTWDVAIPSHLYAGGLRTVRVTSDMLPVPTFPTVKMIVGVAWGRLQPVQLPC